MRVHHAAVLLGIALFLSSTAQAQHTDGQWQTLAPMPSARTEAFGAVVGDRIYVVGGLIDGRVVVSEVEVYDIATDSWSQFAHEVPVALHHASVVSTGGRLYVIGGYTVEGSNLWVALDTIYSIDPVSESEWQQGTPMSVARGALTCQPLDNSIYCAGGKDGPVLSSAEVYIVSEDRWEPIANMPHATEHMASGVVNGKFLVIGGRNGPNVQHTQEYDPLTGSWTLRAELPTARGGIVGVSFDGSVFVFGGEFPGVFDENEEYVQAEDRWISHPEMPTARHGLVGVSHASRIYVISGGPQAGFFYSDVNEVYSPGPRDVVCGACPAPPICQAVVGNDVQCTCSYENVENDAQCSGECVAGQCVMLAPEAPAPAAPAPLPPQPSLTPADTLSLPGTSSATCIHLSVLVMVVAFLILSASL